MARLHYDSAAVAVAKLGAEGEGAVMFKGWLGPRDGVDAADREVNAQEVFFYLDSQWLDYLVLRADDILFQTAAAAHDPEGGSVIFVKREARIKRVEGGRAYWFEQRRAETADDPTARWPRPPQ